MSSPTEVRTVVPTVVPREVATELERLVRRWHQLPLDQALVHAPHVRQLLTRYAAFTHPGTPVPDLGPAVLMDQLTVVIFDAYAKDAPPEGSPPEGAPPEDAPAEDAPPGGVGAARGDVGAELAALRHTLAVDVTRPRARSGLS